MNPAFETPTNSVADMKLPDLTKVPEGDRDRVWFETYYQRGVPQLTVRAIVMGGLLGAVMSVSNLYTTLKLGWSFGVAITACVLSYSLWSGFQKLGLAKTQLSMLENNCMQSTASAAGSSTGSTLATAIGALLMITGDEQRLGWIPVTLWVFLVATLGVFLAIPMKRQMINAEQLPFPSGIAAAETLRSLYAHGRDTVAKARALVYSMAVGGFAGILRSMGILPEAIQIPGQIRAHGTPVSLSALGISFEPSLLLIAAGMIVGLRVSISMVLGSLINWFVLAPWVLSLPNYASSDASKTFLGEMEILAGEGGAVDLVKVTRWSLWLGTSIMVTSGLTSFALGWRTIARAITQFFKGGKAGAGDELSAIEVPTSWMLIGVVPITVALVAVSWLAFGVAPWLALISVALSFVLSLVACRATGETDTTPIGAMGKITQLLYAFLAPASTTTNLMTAGVTAGAAGASADLLIDLKSGYLLGANPRQQFLAQLSGVFFGLLAVIPAWYLLVPNKAALEAFNSPATNMWYAVAQALAHGIEAIPPSARIAIVVGAILGILLPIIESLFPKAKPYLPSAMGLGLAGVVSFANSLAFFIGALIAWQWSRQKPDSAERFVIPIASGVVAGESLAAAAFAMLSSLGILGG